jgi:hypothetical protein
MEKKLLSEELSKMIRMFGYKKGVVISEQKNMEMDEVTAAPVTKSATTTAKPTTPAKLPGCSVSNGQQGNCPKCYKCMGGQCVAATSAGYSQEQFNQCVSTAYPNGNPNR